MAFGLEVRNEAGTVLFDTNHFNYALDSVVQATASVPTLNGGDWESSIAVGNSPHPPLVAMQSLTGATPIRCRPLGVNSWLMDVRTKGAGLITYYPFKRGTLRTSGFGIQTYDANGDVVYSNVDRPLRLLDVITGSDGAASSFTAKTWTYPSSKRVAFICCRWAGYRYLRDAGGGFIETENVVCGLRNVDDHTLQGVHLKMWDFTAGSQGTQRYDLTQPNYQFLVVDVTDYD